MNSKCLRYNLLAAAVLMTSISPSYAQGFKIDPKKLPDASHIERAPMEIQILGPRYRVNDLRTPEENNNLIINVGPPPQAQTHTTVIGAPGVGGANQGGSNMIPITRSGLPKSGFESNMGSLASPPAGQLQAAKPHSVPVDTAVHGQMQPHQGNPGAAHGRPGGMLAHTSQPTPTQTFTYAPTASSIGGGSNSRTTTSVNGELKRGGLINKAQ